MSQPDPLDDLIDALQNLRDLKGVDPVEGFRRCPDLVTYAMAAIKATRGMFAREATDRARPDRLTQDQLATELGLSRKAVTEAIATYRAYERP